MTKENKIVATRDLTFKDAIKPLVQSNKLIESRYNLTVNQQRLLLAMVSQLEKDDEDFQQYRIDLKLFSEVVDITSNDVYGRVKEMTKDLMGKVLTLNEGRRHIQVAWISSATYIDNEGAVVITFDPTLKPYLLHLKEQFTQTKLFIVARFKSFYTMRVYMLLKQYLSIGTRKITVDDLKIMLQTPEAYNKYINLKNRVLLPAMREINKSSDIKISIKTEKRGRRVHALIFTIKEQRIQEPLFIENPKGDITNDITITKIKTVDNFDPTLDKKEKPKEPKQQNEATILSIDFQPTQNTIDTLQGQGYSLEYIKKTVINFIEHWTEGNGAGEKRKRWQSVFRTLVRQEWNMTKENSNSKFNTPRIKF